MRASCVLIEWIHPFGWCRRMTRYRSAWHTGVSVGCPANDWPRPAIAPVPGNDAADMTGSRKDCDQGCCRRHQCPFGMGFLQRLDRGSVYQIAQSDQLDHQIVLLRWRPHAAWFGAGAFGFGEVFCQLVMPSNVRTMARNQSYSRRASARRPALKITPAKANRIAILPGLRAKEMWRGSTPGHPSVEASCRI